MAEVLPSFQNQSSTTMLQSRPTSADTFQPSSQQYSQSTRLVKVPRSMYNGHHSPYKASTTHHVQPYAFQSTPNLRQEHRALLNPSVPQAPNPAQQSGHVASLSASSSETTSTPSARDDSTTETQLASYIKLSPARPLGLMAPATELQAKASPERYRRPASKKPEHSGVPARPLFPTLPSDPDNHKFGLNAKGSVDDLSIKTSANTESAKRYKRRSANSPDFQTMQSITRSSEDVVVVMEPTDVRQMPIALSNEERKIGLAPKGTKTQSTLGVQQSSSPQIPPRISSDAIKRSADPSPLSKQALEQENGTQVKAKTYAAALQSGVMLPSPAAQQLAAVSDKDLNKGMRSRLRRAFSFGPAEELRRARGENNSTAQQTREEHKQRLDGELDAEQLEIARKQEAAGIGAGIYSGQGGFSGSMDNLSISSTASSASMMLRKMGRGAKKGARSIKSLFRPKSVTGVAASADLVHSPPVAPTVQPSVGQVSMVIVEAERQRANVNADASERVSGSTGFPKLGLDSIETGIFPEIKTNSDDDLTKSSRRSIVGNDKDRADVLVAVKKGILKRSGTASPSGSPITNPANLGPVIAPFSAESPTPSMPGTPKDSQANRGQSTGNDYFSQQPSPITKSIPSTPNGTARGITFSPRIQFHDAWSSTEYDRRGEIATCNRLTPLLAQQIKEELNTFKMEMEVHELSKPHTHFF